jgi:hypothetical protein
LTTILTEVKNKMKKITKLFALVMVALALVTSANALLQYQLQIQSSIHIKSSGVRLYTDELLTVAFTEFAPSDMNVGEIITQDIFWKNGFSDKDLHALWSMTDVSLNGNTTILTQEITPNYSSYLIKQGETIIAQIWLQNSFVDGEPTDNMCPEGYEDKIIPANDVLHTRLRFSILQGFSDLYPDGADLGFTLNFVAQDTL